MRDTLPLPVEKLFRSARELEPSAADLDRVFDRTLRRRRGRPLRTAVLAVGAALAMAVGAAAATGKLGIVPGFGDAGTRHDWPGGGFVYKTPLYAVADATVPHFGRVRLTYRRSSAGDCHGIQVFDELGSGVSASHRESCGDSSTFSAATLGDREWLLVYGRAPEKTEQVLLRAHGRDPIPARLIRNAGDVRYLAFLVATPREGLCDVRVSAVGGGLVDVGGMDVQSAPRCNSSSQNRRSDGRWNRPG